MFGVRGITLVLAVLLGLVHLELWFGHSGVPRVIELDRQVEEQRERNIEARMRNERLAAEVRDLREGQETIEEKARGELGMIRPDEILVQYTRPR
ncbi:Septum formation initiator [Leptothrix cholodnii SP-6]|uniref:Cell division protein FtsB n=1 Tax=Leptothrix cholodnii (strain ATCC 51168 / LMG 8142 / SP-6) TaxID=395495 RepID=B1Y4K3_LEPCP|nr:Septum formation initiator [Leptothrix cholodnii SP-6]